MRLPRYYRLFIAAIAVFIGVVAAIAFWPVEKLTATLSDGTIVKLEELELIDERPTWKQKLCMALCEFEPASKLFERLDWWPTAWFGGDGGPFDSYSGFSVRMKISLSNPDRFQDVNETPRLWLCATESQFVEVRGGLSGRDATAEDTDYRNLMTVEEPGRLTTLMAYDPDSTRLVVSFKRMGANIETISFPLDSRLSNETVRKIAREILANNARAFSEPAKPLPCQLEVTGRTELSLQLNAVPREFGRNNGIRLFKKEQDITEDYDISRSGPEQIGTENKWYVSFAMSTKLENIPRDRRFDLPKTKIPLPGEFLEIKHPLLASQKFRGYLMGPGAYFFSGNKLEIASISIGAKRKEFLDTFDRVRERGEWRYNNSTWFYKPCSGEGIFHVDWGIKINAFYFHTDAPCLIFLYDGGPKGKQSPDYIMGTDCWYIWANGNKLEKNIFYHDSFGVSLENVAPGASVDLTVGIGTEMWAGDWIIPAKEDCEAWGKHWAEEKAAKEKQTKAATEQK